MTPLLRRTPLDGHPLLLAHPQMPPGDTSAAVKIALRAPIAVLQVSAFAPDIDAAAARLSAALKLALPQANRLTGDDALSLRATGPGIWQIVGDPGRVPDAAALRSELEAR